MVEKKAKPDTPPVVAEPAAPELTEDEKNEAARKAAKQAREELRTGVKS